MKWLDATTVPRTGAPRKPRDVKIDPTKKTWTADEFKQLLASQGVKVNFVDANAAPAAASAGNTGAAASAPKQPAANTGAAK